MSFKVSSLQPVCRTITDLIQYKAPRPLDILNIAKLCPVTALEYHDLLHHVHFTFEIKSVQNISTGMHNMSCEFFADQNSRFSKSLFKFSIALGLLQLTN